MKRSSSVSVEQAAARLQVSRRTIYNHIRSGHLRTVRTMGGSQRVTPDSLVALQASLVPRGDRFYLLDAGADRNERTARQQVRKRRVNSPLLRRFEIANAVSTIVRRRAVELCRATRHTRSLAETIRARSELTRRTVGDNLRALLRTILRA
jgi:excisionase family DNA binding protein